jgi:hypothetical protein
MEAETMWRYLVQSAFALHKVSPSPVPFKVVTNCKFFFQLQLFKGIKGKMVYKIRYSSLCLLWVYEEFIIQSGSSSSDPLQIVLTLRQISCLVWSSRFYSIGFKPSIALIFFNSCIHFPFTIFTRHKITKICSSVSLNSIHTSLSPILGKQL